jgi:hypothetical protein
MSRGWMRRVRLTRAQFLIDCLPLAVAARGLLMMVSMGRCLYVRSLSACLNSALSCCAECVLLTLSPWPARCLRILYRVSSLDKDGLNQPCLLHVDLWLRAWIGLWLLCRVCSLNTISLDRKMRISSLISSSRFRFVSLIDFLVSFPLRFWSIGGDRRYDEMTRFCQCTTRYSFNVKKERLFHWTAAVWHDCEFIISHLRPSS